LLSAERTVPSIVTRMHRVFPYLTVLSTAILILSIF
jgi:hypothetical protein